MNQIQTTSLPQIHIRLNTLNFEVIVNEAIDQALTKLGQRVKLVIYYSFEKRYRLKPKSIPNRIRDFENALEQTFGPSALLIELEIMKNVRKKVPKFEYSVDEGDVDFGDYLQSLKSYLQAFG